MRVKENLSYLKAKKDRPLSYHEISTTIKKQKFPKKGFIQKLYKNSYSTKRSTKRSTKNHVYKKLFPIKDF